MNAKSELLATEIEQKKVELLQERVDGNSRLINDLTNKLVADYCKSLDEYVRFIQGILHDTKNPPTADEMDEWIMNLPVLLYFCGEAQENLGIKSDVAKSIKQEKYNEVYRTLQKGTISDKTSRAELETQSEEVTRIIYDRAYKIVKEKMTAAYELLSSVKKVISRRMSEYEISNIDSGRFSNGK